MAETLVSVIAGAVGLTLLLSIVYSAGLPTWIATIMAGLFGASQVVDAYPLRIGPLLAVALGATAACALAERIIFRSARAFRFAACASGIATAAILIGSSFDHPPLEWQDENDMYSFGSHGGFWLLEAGWVDVFQSVSMAFAMCGFALGSFRLHSFAWSRHLYRVCVSMVLLYVLGLILNWRLGENGALDLFKRLSWPAISLVWFGVLLQIATGVQVRLVERPTLARRGRILREAVA
jgi:hypothetical protein